MAFRLREELEEVEVLEVALRDRTFRPFPCLPEEARIDVVLAVVPARRRAHPSLVVFADGVRGGAWFVGTTSRSPGAPFLVAFASDERLERAREDLRAGRAIVDRDRA